MLNKVQEKKNSCKNNELEGRKENISDCIGFIGCIGSLATHEEVSDEARSKLIPNEDSINYGK